MDIITVSKLRKSYRKGQVQALRGLNFTVDEGEIYGLIGPDGAGKTTLFRIMATLLLPDEGTVSVDGLDVVRDYKAIRRRIGYMPGRFSLYQDLSVEENLSFFASIFHTSIEENYDLVKDIYGQIEPFKTRKAGKLSGGMKQKLALSCALIHAPRVLILDEPTTGVDPVSRKEFWEMLKRLKAEGITMVVSTPYMDEARLCDRIALIKDGRFLGIDKPNNITASFRTPLWAAKSQHMYHLLNDLRAYPDIDNCYVSGEYHHFTTRGEGFDTDALNRYLTSKGHAAEVKQIEATIEDCYMHLAKTASRESE